MRDLPLKWKACRAELGGLSCARASGRGDPSSRVAPLPLRRISMADVEFPTKCGIMQYPQDNSVYIIPSDQNFRNLILGGFLFGRKFVTGVPITEDFSANHSIGFPTIPNPAHSP